MWLSRLLAELLGRPVDIVELKVDSKSALALAKNPVVGVFPHGCHTNE